MVTNESPGSLTDVSFDLFACRITTSLIEEGAPTYIDTNFR